MGGGDDVKPEYMLLVLPAPEPVDILERIRKEHPQIRITYHQTTFTKVFQKEEDIPRGENSSASHSRLDWKHMHSANRFHVLHKTGAYEQKGGRIAET